MAASATEKLGIANNDVDRAAETVALQTIREARGVMLIWVSSQFIHYGTRSAAWCGQMSRLNMFES